MFSFFRLKTIPVNRAFISPVFNSPRRINVAHHLEIGCRRIFKDVIYFNHIEELKNITHNDVLFIWNRHLKQDFYAKLFEKNGARVIVLENPYIQLNKEPYISVGIGWHNNIRYAPKQFDKGKRFKNFDVTIQPWRKGGEHILVTTQAKIFNSSGIGHESYRQPQNWDYNICHSLRSITNRPIVFRKHPNGYDSENSKLRTIKNLKISDGKTPIENDLKNAWCTVLHTSNSATESIINGIPVFYTGNNIFLKDACEKNFLQIEKPKLLDNREGLLYHMAWCQFSLKEIENGFMLKRVLK